MDLKKIEIRAAADPPGSPRRHRKRAIIADLLAHIMTIGASTMPDLDIDDLLMVNFIAGRGSAGKHTTTANLPFYLNRSDATTNRRLKKLIDMGYIERFRQGKTYCYALAKRAHESRYMTDNGIDTLDMIVNKLLAAAREIENL